MARRRAFTLIELLIAISIVALLIAIMLPSLGEMKRLGRLTVTQSNLKQHAVAAASYAVDYEDEIFTYSWKEGEAYLMMNLDGEYELEIMEINDMCASGAQAVDIMRRRADRIGDHPMNHLVCWFPHMLYSHLILFDYLASRLPEPAVVDPNDKHRLNWQDDPKGKFDEGYWMPYQPDPDGDYNARWPYSSSYTVVPAAYDSLQSDTRDLPEINARRMAPATVHYKVMFPADCNLKSMQFDDVTHPSLKVHMHDSHDRHFDSREPFYGLDRAKLPLLFFDGSVRVERTGDANPGWRPSSPSAPCQPFKYEPLEAWEPATISGDYYDYAKGYYRWTRGGLRGIDFSGKPLETGQATPGVCNY